MRVRMTDRLLWRAAIATVLFAALEAAGGYWTGSLALLSDAGHMLTDAVALALGALAARIARAPPSSRHSYGLGRAEIFAAAINASTMLVIAAAIAHEAVQRLNEPGDIHGAAAAAIALAGLALNLAIVKWLLPHRHDMNARAAALHVLGDLLGSIAAIASGAVITLTGWIPIDALASLLIALLIAVSSLRLLHEAFHALMEGVPLRLSVEELGRQMAAAEGVDSVHDLHVWTLSGSRIALSAHVVVRDLSRWDRTLAALRALLRERFGIEHVTLQPEPATAPLVRVPVPDPGRRKR
jgi:cobalt-zinc-cadmium efflux system protein